MDKIAESTASAVPAGEDSEPSKNQTLKNRGRTNTPLLKGVLVYDWDQKTVHVQSEKDVRKQLQLNHRGAELIVVSIPVLEDYTEIKIPTKRKQVTIFVDPETESQPTTESTAPNGQSNVVLANLYLDRLGKYHQLLRFIGLLSTLYVMKAAPWSGSSSQITTQSIGGAVP